MGDVKACAANVFGPLTLSGSTTDIDPNKPNGRAGVIKEESYKFPAKGQRPGGTLLYEITPDERNSYASALTDNDGTIYIIYPDNSPNHGKYRGMTFTGSTPKQLLPLEDCPQQNL